MSEEGRKKRGEGGGGSGPPEIYISSDMQALTQSASEGKEKRGVRFHLQSVAHEISRAAHLGWHRRV